jgi:DNA-binding beta-propeller fold protein YncE
MTKLGRWLLLTIVVLIGVVIVVAQDGGENNVGSEYAGTVPAPEFAEGLDWLNVNAPLTMESLRGKVVLLDFWTYGCINCIHMIPVLEQLEAKYPDELVIIGVHSAKFATEGDTENIRQIIQRYDLHHPVINDKDFIVFQTFGARGWPHFVLVDPAGNVLAAQGGEIPFDAFDRIIGGMVAYFDGLGQINREPITISLEGADSPNQALSFPGKVTVDEAGRRLFIADSNHHRIVVADLNTYEILDVIGAGQRGLKDGDFEEALFNKPQGMEIVGDKLYVADTNNHAIRELDFATRTVKTIAGTGNQGTVRVAFGAPIDFATSFDLRSPWDVELGDNDRLYIAMAGTHQIWAYDLDSELLIGGVVGNGGEALYNESLANSQLAQPSGLYYKDGLLYFADSESSSVRVADFNQDQVRTLAGTPNNDLFDFGDIDGSFGTSRLQHALGVVGGDSGLLYIADTYNSKIKVYDAATTETKSLFGLGAGGGFRDGGPADAQFDEPGGLDYANGKLYVADTNNHAIRVIDLALQDVTTIVFPNPEKLKIEGQATIVGGNTALGAQVTLPEQALSAGAGEIVFKLSLPEGYKINDLIASSVALTSQDGHILIPADNAATTIDSLEVHVPVTLQEGSDTLHADLTLYYCRTGEESLCFIESVVVQAPVSIGPTGGFETAIVIEREVVPPEIPESGGL